MMNLTYFLSNFEKLVIDIKYRKPYLSVVRGDFTGQSNMSINYGVHASLHPNCHHQIVHSF